MTHKERAEAVLKAIEFRGEIENWDEVAGLIEKSLDEALEKGALAERERTECGHPRACLRGAADGHERCTACDELSEVADLVRRALDWMTRNAVCNSHCVFCQTDVGDAHSESCVATILDRAFAKAFRPVRIKGKPLSETIIEDRR